jgi:hypothetical protein
MVNSLHKFEQITLLALHRKRKRKLLQPIYSVHWTFCILVTKEQTRMLDNQLECNNSEHNKRARKN